MDNKIEDIQEQIESVIDEVDFWINRKELEDE